MMVGEDSDSPDLAVDKVIDVRLRRRHGNAARASVGAGPDESQYLIVADPLQVLDVDVKVRGSVLDIGKEAPYPLRAFIDTREDLRRPRRPQTPSKTSAHSSSISGWPWRMWIAKCV